MDELEVYTFSIYVHFFYILFLVFWYFNLSEAMGWRDSMT